MRDMRVLTGRSWARGGCNPDGTYFGTLGQVVGGGVRLSASVIRQCAARPGLEALGWLVAGG